MRAMVLISQNKPLEMMDLDIPTPSKDQVLIKVHACAVCRTDLHIRDGELKHPKLPLILGHQIVGEVVSVGENGDPHLIGKRVGVPWLGKTCGSCPFCLSHRENLCDTPLFTGYQINGGFAEYAVAYQQFVFPLPDEYSDEQAAPLLCGGLIGFRAYRMAHHAKFLGLIGFGSSAHILLQLARYEGKKVYVFTRDGDKKTQEFAKKLGADWAGGTSDTPPHLMDASIIFAPVGELVPIALKNTEKGGKVICAGIHMSDIPTFPYEFLWEEREIRSVANLTRKDGIDFLALAPKVPIETVVTVYPLDKVNQALDDLKAGKIEGSAVITLTLPRRLLPS